MKPEETTKADRVDKFYGKLGSSEMVEPASMICFTVMVELG